MSLDLTYSRQWEDAKTKLLPQGATVSSSLVVVDEVMTATSVVGESAKKTKYIQARAGEKVTFSVLARVTSVGGTGAIAIDYPTPGDLLSMQRITSTDWQEYSISASIPLTAPVNGYVSLQAGLFNSDAGTVEFTCPKVTKGNSQIGASQSIAKALLYFDITDRLPKINKGFVHHGIYSLYYDVPTKTLTITTDTTTRDDQEAGSERLPLFPIITGAMTFDNIGASLTIKYGGYNNVTGEFFAKFYNASGALVDMSTIASAGSMYFTVKVEA